MFSTPATVRSDRSQGGVRVRIIATFATVAALFGAACFLWVILGDLFAAIHDAAPLPDPLEMAGPLLFQLGILTLLIQLVTARPRRLHLGVRCWSSSASCRSPSTSTCFRLAQAPELDARPGVRL
jgi:hypothetical protein